MCKKKKVHDFNLMRKNAGVKTLYSIKARSEIITSTTTTAAEQLRYNDKKISFPFPSTNTLLSKNL